MEFGKLGSLADGRTREKELGRGAGGVPRGGGNAEGPRSAATATMAAGPLSPIPPSPPAVLARSCPGRCGLAERCLPQGWARVWRGCDTLGTFPQPLSFPHAGSVPPLPGGAGGRAQAERPQGQREAAEPGLRVPESHLAAILILLGLLNLAGN